MVLTVASNKQSVHLAVRASTDVGYMLCLKGICTHYGTVNAASKRPWLFLSSKMLGAYCECINVGREETSAK